MALHTAISEYWIGDPHWVSAERPNREICRSLRGWYFLDGNLLTLFAPGRQRGRHQRGNKKHMNSELFSEAPPPRMPAAGRSFTQSPQPTCAKSRHYPDALLARATFIRRHAPESARAHGGRSVSMKAPTRPRPAPSPLRFTSAQLLGEVSSVFLDASRLSRGTALA